jgi:hypothetical protein
MGFASRTSFTLLAIWLASATVKLVRDSKPKTNSGGATLPSFSKQALVRARAGV